MKLFLAYQDFACLMLLHSCPTLCDPMDCSPPGFLVHGILVHSRILPWVAISFSRGSSWFRDWTCISCVSRWILDHWATREAPWTSKTIFLCVSKTPTARTCQVRVFWYILTSECSLRRSILEHRMLCTWNLKIQKHSCLPLTLPPQPFLGKELGGIWQTISLVSAKPTAWSVDEGSCIEKTLWPGPEWKQYKEINY